MTLRHSLPALAMLPVLVAAAPATPPAASPAPVASAAPVPAANPPAPQAVLVPQGTALALVTTATMTSGNTRTGQQVPMKVRDAVLVDGKVVIPAGADAVGVVAESRDTGGFGVNGRLVLAPLYLTIAGETVRLVGGDLYQGKTKGDTVAGIFFTPLVSGRKAVVPQGAAIGARVMRDIRLPVIATP